MADKIPAINLSPNPLGCEYRQKKQKLSLKNEMYCAQGSYCFYSPFQFLEGGFRMTISL